MIVRRLSLLALVFVVGSLFGALDLQPARFLADGFGATIRLAQETVRTKPDLLYPIRHEGNGVTKWDRGMTQRGLTMVQVMGPDGHQLRLLDMEGNELHRWTVDFFAAWPSPDHIRPEENVPTSPLHYHTQGFEVHRDGSVLVNVAGKGSVLLDKCSRVSATIDRMTHHSVTRAPDGGFWLPGHAPPSELDPDLAPVGRSVEWIAEQTAEKWDYYENTVFRADAQGRVFEEFSVLRAIHDAGLEVALHDARNIRETDPTHLNDIEIVTPALADRIEDVAPGDLLLSLRTMNMLAILDRDDGSLKWHRRGPWVRQHDPDITPDGRIEIFNNRSRQSASFVSGSEIVSYDPASDEITVIHPQTEESRFYSPIMGTHQRLDNDNVLITESTAGRVMEVTQDGTVAWELVLPYDDESATLIPKAQRLPREFFNVSDWNCGGN